MCTEAGLDHLRTIAVHLFSSKCNLKGMRDRKQTLQLKLIIYRLKKKPGGVFGFRIIQQPTYFKSQKQEKDTTENLCRGKTVQKQNWLQKGIIIWDMWPQV